MADLPKEIIAQVESANELKPDPGTATSQSGTTASVTSPPELPQIKSVPLATTLQIIAGAVVTVFNVTAENGKTGTGYIPGAVPLTGESNGFTNYMLWTKLGTTTYFKLEANETSLVMTFFDEESRGLGTFTSPWSKDDGTIEGVTGYFKWAQ